MNCHHSSGSRNNQKELRAPVARVNSAALQAIQEAQWSESKHTRFTKKKESENDKKRAIVAVKRHPQKQRKPTWPRVHLPSYPYNHAPLLPKQAIKSSKDNSASQPGPSSENRKKAPAQQQSQDLQRRRRVLVSNSETLVSSGRLGRPAALG